jgi:hypothetical protein
MTRPIVGAICLAVAAAITLALAMISTPGGDSRSPNLAIRSSDGHFSDVDRLDAARPAMLLADTAAEPTLELAWQTNSGWERCTATLGYTSAAVREPFCGNLDAFLTLGGTRLDKGAGDPTGLIVRVGFYKLDSDELLLPSIAAGGWVALRLDGLRFNQPVRVRTPSVLAHLKYGATALESCNAPRELADVYLSASERDKLAGKLVDDRALRPAYLRVSDDRPRRPTEPGRALPPERLTGRAHTRVAADGSVSLEVLFPYAAFRHVLGVYQDPAPGGFAEPDHFHVEVEVLPAGR